ncbi:hypothetical protein GR254_07385 [Mycobacterium tuberculosis]|nr:hypothetical protein [Mycobacterium tuberculosis]
MHRRAGRPWRSDPQTRCRGRRAQWMVAAIRSAVKLRVHHLAGYVPATLQPIMDVRLTKR